MWKIMILLLNSRFIRNCLIAKKQRIKEPNCNLFVLFLKILFVVIAIPWKPLTNALKAKFIHQYGFTCHYKITKVSVPILEVC